MPAFIENKLIETFKGQGSVSREQLFVFFRQFDPELK
jgi:hypothetical protein